MRAGTRAAFFSVEVGDGLSPPETTGAGRGPDHHATRAQTEGCAARPSLKSLMTSCSGTPKMAATAFLSCYQ